jgi:hypothetical protein
MIAYEILPIKGVDVGGGKEVRSDLVPQLHFVIFYYCVIELYRLVWMSIRIDQELPLLLRQCR